MGNQVIYYLATPFCSRVEIQIFQKEDLLLHVVHPNNLGNFLCRNSHHKLVNYFDLLLDSSGSLNLSEEEFDQIVDWFKMRFDRKITLGALPDFPRNKNS